MTQMMREQAIEAFHAWEKEVNKVRY